MLRKLGIALSLAWLAATLTAAPCTDCQKAKPADCCEHGRCKRPDSKASATCRSPEAAFEQADPSFARALKAVSAAAPSLPLPAAAFEPAPLVLEQVEVVQDHSPPDLCILHSVLLI